jgi:oligosaccharide repeat unit polymerase
MAVHAWSGPCDPVPQIAMITLALVVIALALLSFLSYGFVLSKILCVFMGLMMLLAAVTMPRDRSTGIFNPWTIFILSFVQYYVLGPFETVYLYDAMHYATVIYGHLRPIPSDDLVLSRAIFVSVIGLICVWAGYQVYSLDSHGRLPTVETQWFIDPLRLRKVILVCLGVGVASYALFFAKVGLIAYLTTQREMRHFLYAKAAAYGFFSDFVATAFVLASVYLLEIHRDRERRTIVLILAMLIPYVYFQMAVFSGSRITVIRPILILSIYYMLTRGRTELTVRLVLLAMGLVVFVVVGGVVRSYLGVPQGGELALALLRQAWNHPKDWYGFITESMDYVQCYDILLLLTNRSYPLGYGATYLKFIYQFIPRVIWPNKPIDVTTMMSELFRPGQVAKGDSYGPTLFGEMYYNFGISGIVIGCFVVGIVLGWMYRLGRKQRGSAPLRFFYATLLVSIIEQGRGAFYNISLTYGMFYIIPLLFACRRRHVGVAVIGASDSVVRSRPG